MDALFELVGNIIKAVVNFISEQIDRTNEYFSKVAQARKTHHQTSHSNDGGDTISSPVAENLMDDVKITDLSAKEIETLSAINLSDVDSYSLRHVENVSDKNLAVSLKR